jgi:cytochrome b
MVDSFAKRQARFDEWHKSNLGIWEYFQRFSFEAMHHGHKKISHWLIINRIRWEVFIVTTGKDFKISNDFIAFYARLWQKTYPQHKTLFNTKRMLGEPYQQEE